MIRLAQINLRGIAQKLTEINALLLNFNLDVVLISELKINHHNRQLPPIVIPGYKLYYTSLSAGIIIRENIRVEKSVAGDDNWW